MSEEYYYTMHADMDALAVSIVLRVLLQEDARFSGIGLEMQWYAFFFTLF